MVVLVEITLSHETDYQQVLVSSLYKGHLTDLLICHCGNSSAFF